MIETRGGDDFSRDGVVAEVPAEFNSAYLADADAFVPTERELAARERARREYQELTEDERRHRDEFCREVPYGTPDATAEPDHSLDADIYFHRD